MSFLRSPLAPRHSHSPITPFKRSIPSLPFEILLLLLSQDQSPSFLAKLLLLNSDVYDLVLPYLYKKVVVSRDNAGLLIWGIKVHRPAVGPGSFVFRPPIELLADLDLNSNSSSRGMAGMSKGSGIDQSPSNTDKRFTMYSPSSSIGSPSPSTSISTSAPAPASSSTLSQGGPSTGSPANRTKHRRINSLEPCSETEQRKRYALSLIRTLVLIDGMDVTSAETWLHLVRPLTSGSASAPDSKLTALMPILEKVVIHAEVLMQLVQWKYMSKGGDREHDLVRVLRALLVGRGVRRAVDQNHRQSQSQRPTSFHLESPARPDVGQGGEVDWETDARRTAGPISGSRPKGVTIEITGSFLRKSLSNYSALYRSSTFAPNVEKSMALGLNTLANLLSDPELDPDPGTASVSPLGTESAHGAGGGRAGPAVDVERFVWHGLTRENLPFIRANKVEWHFVDPVYSPPSKPVPNSNTGSGRRISSASAIASASTVSYTTQHQDGYRYGNQQHDHNRYDYDPNYHGTEALADCSTTTYQRAAKIRSVLLRDQEANPASDINTPAVGNSALDSTSTSTSPATRYLIIGSGIGLERDPSSSSSSPVTSTSTSTSTSHSMTNQDPKTELEKLEREVAAQSKLMEVVRTGSGGLGGGTIDESIWGRVEWVTSSSASYGSLSDEEMEQLGAGCGCYPLNRASQTSTF